MSSIVPIITRKIKIKIKIVKPTLTPSVLDKNIISTYEPIEITPSILQTKQWRTNCSWYRGGKHNECEIYQRSIILSNKEKQSLIASL